MSRVDGEQARGPFTRASLRRRWPHLEAPLPSEDEIRASWSADEPVVTILCATYNHSALIEDAIRGFLTQRTTYPFEIVLRDDASTDGTQEVLRRYADLYPGLVRLELLPENRWLTHGGWLLDAERLAPTRYVAICEGDDFWVDRDKLQRQVEALEADASVVLCVSGSLVVEVASGQEQRTGLFETPFTYRGLPHHYHHTSTFVIRTPALVAIVDKYFRSRRGFGDTGLVSLLLHEGDVSVVPGVVSVYWFSGYGLWSRLTAHRQDAARLGVLARLVVLAPWRTKRDEMRRYLAFARRFFTAAVREERGGNPVMAEGPAQSHIAASRFVSGRRALAATLRASMRMDPLT